MIAAKIDMLAEKRDSFAHFAEKRLYIFFGTSTGSNIAACVISAVAAGLLTGSDNALLRIISVAAAAIVWVQASVLSGFLRQWLFVIFSAVYLILPHVLVIVPDTIAAQQATEMQYVISDIMQAVILRPISMLAGSADLMTVSVTVFAVSMFLFSLGYAARLKARRSNFYCRTRLEQLK